MECKASEREDSTIPQMQYKKARAAHRKIKATFNVKGQYKDFAWYKLHALVENKNKFSATLV